MTEDATVLLFSYGTLQQENVQLSSFGRRLEGRPTPCRAGGAARSRSPIPR